MRRLLSLLFVALPLIAQSGGQLRLSLRHDPKTFDPLLVDENAGETIRYLTGGVLVRLNRVSQKLEPELAKSWKITDGGRKLTLELREQILFSDGTPFTAEDVAFTFRRMLDPALHSPTADSFRSGAGQVIVSIPRVSTPRRNIVVIVFPAPIASLDRLLDQVVIQSQRSPLKERAVLGPFRIAEHKPGAFLELRRNPNYWKRDNAGAQLPYLDSIRFDILGNRDIETLRFTRGELDMLEGVEAETYDRLRHKAGVNTINIGPSTDVEMLWFNLVDTAPINVSRKKWFRLREFRQAISAALNRDDMIRLAYRGYGKASMGPVPMSSPWFNRDLKPQRYEPAEALGKLAALGFRLNRGQLYDSSGTAVSFSLITNSANKVRSRLAALIQDDLKKIGIQINITVLDFPSLIERITKTFDYDACLLGLTNVDPDPNSQMNIWLSSAANHQWNPKQPVPATPWEAEIDKLMRVQASAATDQARKRAFNQVQEIVAREVPFVYLVNRDALGAVSSSIRNISPAPLRPNLYWNAERLRLEDDRRVASHVRPAAAR